MTAADPPVLIQQGAEARIYKHTVLNAHIPSITKIRFKKAYRISALDNKLSTNRLVQEARMLKRARDVAGVLTPRVLFIDKIHKSLTMELIDAPTVRHYLLSSDSVIPQLLDLLSKHIGTAIAQLHKAQLIHGDLTTSNMLFKRESKSPEPKESSDVKIVMIDFGLAFSSSNVEDKAVDLYVLERAVQSTHPMIQEHMLAQIFIAYGAADSAARSVLKKLDDVRLRGRKRSMIG